MTTDSAFDDKALQASIKSLKTMLTQVLKSQANPKIMATVEQLQKQFAALQRDDTPTKRKQLMDTLKGLPADTLTEVIRAFSLYFSLLNIAEEATNLRNRRKDIENNKHFSPRFFP